MLSVPFADVEVGTVGTVRIFTGLSEPCMLIGAVVNDKIHNDVNVPGACLEKEKIEAVEIAEAGIDIVIIRDIVALVGKWGAVHRRDPEDTDAESFQILQFDDDALDITDAIAVRVTKALGPDLIGNLILPPFLFHSTPRKKSNTINQAIIIPRIIFAQNCHSV
jgi:hypothetical protein